MIPANTMPITYYTVSDAAGYWQASFRYEDDAEACVETWSESLKRHGFREEHDPFTIHKVQVTADDGCGGQWCEDATCPACAGW